MRVVAAMSGGVDSSVAAITLHRAGHEVLGTYLQMRTATGLAESNCVSPKHEEDARGVAESASIGFQTLDMRDAFEIEIVQPFLDSYLQGETPNPCVMCNVKVKLGPLVRWAVEHGYDKICTGHYARITMDENSGRWELRRGRDPRKDQSYYLCGLSQKILSRLILPLGEMEKTDTRAMALAWGLPVAEKADSQDICIAASEGDYRQFLSGRMGRDFAAVEGPIVNASGEELGRHSGLFQYTIGQRKGLGISHLRPLYVVELLPECNTLVVGEEEELYSRNLCAASFNWSSGTVPSAGESFRAMAQIRYQHKAAWASVRAESATEISVEFDLPQRAIAPGQTVALYDGDRVIGGGTIRRHQREALR